MAVLSPTLRGQSVSLVPMAPSHIEALFAISRDPEIWRYLPEHVTTLQEMESFVATALQEAANGTTIPFVISVGADIVGSTRLVDLSHKDRGVEIGWTWLTPAVWRTSVNTECKYVLLKYCFEELKLIRVMLKTDSRNMRSQTAIARIGAKHEGVLRNHRILHDGYIRDSVIFSVIDSEWPDVAADLRHKLQLTG